LRAVELLEYEGSPEAGAVLEQVAKTAARGAERADAAAALRRLARAKAAARE
jgi:hypothetical protein